MAATWKGRPLERIEDLRLLSGRGRYLDDISLDDELHVAFLRSPHGHARIRTIDTSMAAEADGVLAVYTAEDLGELNRPLPVVIPVGLTGTEKTQVPLAGATVRFVGEPVAAVLATSRYEAEDALDLIMVEYEPRPAVVDVTSAAEPDAPLVHEDRPDNVATHMHQVVGDPDGAFARAEQTLALTLTIHRGSTQPIEPRGALASYDGNELCVWISTQRPHRHADALGEMLPVERDRVRVIVPDVGGGFGPKGSIYPEEIVVAWLAYRHQRPVKWTEDRREHFLATLQERDQVHHVEVAFAGDGAVLAFRDRFVHDAGAYVPYGPAVLANTVMHMPGPYAIEALEIDGRSIYTNAVPTGPNRGAGRPQGAFIMERVMDAVARTLGLSPFEVRRRNFVPAGEMPHRTGVVIHGNPVEYDSGDYRATFDAVVEAIDVPHVREEQADARRRGRYIGLGIAAYTESTGHGSFEGARILLDSDGIFKVYTGAPSQGQGHYTTYAQVCADELGVTPAQIKVVHSDTGQVARGIGTFASRTAILAGSGLSLASKRLRERILDVAGTELEVAPADLTLTDAGVVVTGAPGRSLSFEEVVVVAGEQAVDLDVTEYFESPENAWANGAFAVVVEINPDNGFLAVRRAVFVHDCGTVINPKIVDGQIVGGVVQALGGTLLEKIIYDNSGQLVTASFMDYLLPSSTEVPAITVIHRETPSPTNPLGVKGAGEGGVMPVAPAITQAVEDALADWDVTHGVPFRGIDRVPIFPEDIWRLITQRQRRTA